MIPGESLGILLSGLASSGRLEGVEITGVCSDSREVRPGDLFLALPGARNNGFEFIAEAARRGAVAAVADAGAAIDACSIPVVTVPDIRAVAGVIAARFFGNPSSGMDVVGVTGTNGKTSVSHYIAQVLAESSSPVGLVGTLGYGLLGALDPGLHTTPDAVTLQRLLAGMQGQGARHAVMEVSSHALSQGRVAGVEFRVGVFTNLSRDHLDYHGDMQAYGASKRKLFAMPGLACAVVNVDDPFSRELIAAAGTARVIGYGINDTGTGTLPAETIGGRVSDEGPGTFTLAIDSPWGTARARIPLTGRFNACNALAALAAACALGVSLEEAVERLGRLKPVAGRMEYFTAPGAPAVIVDYAHTPDALAKALSALREVCRGKLVCVFGCGGDRDRGKRPEMGRTAESLADHVVVTSDNPRTEPPQRIIDEILAGLQVPERAAVEPDRATAVALAIRAAGDGDVVLVAGKGHESYQEIDGRRYPFSDRELVRRLLGGTE